MVAFFFAAVFFAAVFFAGIFFDAVFFAGIFFDAVFFAGIFFAAVFFDAVVFAGVFFAGVIFAGVFFAGVFFDAVVFDAVFFGAVVFDAVFAAAFFAAGCFIVAGISNISVTSVRARGWAPLLGLTTADDGSIRPGTSSRLAFNVSRPAQRGSISSACSSSTSSLTPPLRRQGSPSVEPGDSQLGCGGSSRKSCSRMTAPTSTLLPT